MVVCHCKAVNDTSIKALLDNRRLTIDDIASHCGAGTDCGACLDTIKDLLASFEHRSVGGS